MAEPSLFDNLLEKLIGTSSSTNVDETLGVTNLLKQLSGTNTSQNQTNTGTTTQSTNADVSKLNQVFNQQQAGITPDALRAIFTEGSKAVPGLTAATANAVGARSSGNSALATSLTDLNTNLTSQAATQSQAMRNAAAGTAAQIADLTKTITGSNTGNQNTSGVTNQTSDTTQNQGTVRNLDTRTGSTINAKSAGLTAGTALLASLLGGGGDGKSSNLTDLLTKGGGLLSKFFGGDVSGNGNLFDGITFGGQGVADNGGADIAPIFNFGDQSGGTDWTNYFSNGWADGGIVPTPQLRLSNQSDSKKKSSAFNLSDLLPDLLGTAGVKGLLSSGGGSVGGTGTAESNQNGTDAANVAAPDSPTGQSTAVGNLVGNVVGMGIGMVASPVTGFVSLLNALTGKVAPPGSPHAIPTLSDVINSIGQIGGASTAVASATPGSVGTVSVGNLGPADAPNNDPTGDAANGGPAGGNDDGSTGVGDSGVGVGGIGSGGGDGSGGGAGATGWKDGGYLPMQKNDPTGTKDTIVAKVHGKAMPALSGGEFIMPKDVVDMIGPDKLQAIIDMFHTPADLEEQYEPPGAPDEEED